MDSHDLCVQDDGLRSGRTSDRLRVQFGSAKMGAFDRFHRRTAAKRTRAGEERLPHHWDGGRGHRGSVPGSLFAQEPVLFLGSLAIRIGFCTIASKQTRNFASYGFVLSGYTAAIVGVTGALAPANAFGIATARVTEISLGI